MPIEDANTIDIIGFEELSGTVRMIMTEHREWLDIPQMLLQLAAKVDAYLHYVESGQLIAEEPNYLGRPVVLDLHCLFAPPPEMLPPLRHVKETLAESNVGFGVHLGPDETGNTSKIALDDFSAGEAES